MGRLFKPGPVRYSNLHVEVMCPSQKDLKVIDGKGRYFYLNGRCMTYSGIKKFYFHKQYKSEECSKKQADYFISLLREWGIKRQIRITIKSYNSWSA